MVFGIASLSTIPSGRFTRLKQEFVSNHELLLGFVQEVDVVDVSDEDSMDMTEIWILLLFNAGHHRIEVFMRYLVLDLSREERNTLHIWMTADSVLVFLLYSLLVFDVCDFNVHQDCRLFTGFRGPSLIRLRGFSTDSDLMLREK